MSDSNGDLKQWLSQQAVGSFDHLPYELFDHPCTIRQLTGAERDELEKARVKRFPRDRDLSVDDINWNNIRALHVSYYLGDVHGNRIYTSASDVEAIGMWPAKLVEEIYALGLKQNGIDEDAVEDAKKNLETTRS